MMDSNFVLDPTPDEWLTNHRWSIVNNKIAPSYQFLRGAQVLEIVLKHFICQEFVNEYSSDQGYLEWARSVWSHRLDQLFLENKSKLDQVSCRLVRVSNQGLALEMYHRLLEKEVTLEQLSIQYGEGQERFKGGFFQLQNIENLPEGIQFYLRKMSIGEVTKPITIGKQVALLQLVEKQPAVRSPETVNRLLERQFQLWLQGMSKYLADHLQLLEDDSKNSE